MKGFEDFLKGDSPLAREALTDRSYRRTQDCGGCAVNGNLATVGDSVLGLALCDILRQGPETRNLGMKKRRYGCNRVLVTVVAEHYDILSLLRYDREDAGKQHGYAWGRGISPQSQKYLATAVEAALGAFYIEHGRRMSKVIPLVRYWMRLADEKCGCAGSTSARP